MRKLRIGDRVECTRQLRDLDLYTGDTGIVLATFSSFDASVHFDKWDHGEDQGWSDDSAFCIDVNDLQLIQKCMFSKGGDAT